MVFEGSTIKIKISSSDLVGLRASINSYFKWLSTLIGALEVLEDVIGGHKESPDVTATSSVVGLTA